MYKSANWLYLLQVSSEKARPSAASGADEDEVEEELVDVPYEYEVEEIREQDVVKEEVVERPVPQIKALFPYKGNGMEMQKGEVGNNNEILRYNF